MIIQLEISIVLETLSQHNTLILFDSSIVVVLPGERWMSGKLEFMLSQRGKVVALQKFPR